MSERTSSIDLGSSAEILLRSFPVPERDWEQDAQMAEARLAGVAPGSAEPAWLAAPFPREAGESIAPASATATPLASSGVRPQSFAELARRSVQNKQAGEREMARASLALAAQRRPNAEEVRALREAITSKLPASPASASPASPSPASPSPASALTPSLVASSPASEERRWFKPAAIGAAVLLAASVLLWRRQPVPASPESAAVQTRVNATSPTADARTPPGPAPQGVPSGIDPSTLPESAAPARLPRDASAVVSHPPVLAPPKVQRGDEKIELEDEPVAAAAASAASEQHAIPSAKAVEPTLPPDTALRPADSTGGAVPAKPSTGAVQAALGAVMSGARHCVAGEDGPSSALVVFGSDGRVRRVAVSGAASGKSSASCIEAQLSRARVQPFAAPSFSVNATVRPD